MRRRRSHCCARQRNWSTPPTRCGRSPARATSPFRCSLSAGRPARWRRCISAASMLDAAAPGLRGDFRGTRGRTALVLTAISWALLGSLIHRRNVASQQYFEEPLREALGDDYEAVAAQSEPHDAARRSACGRTSGPPPVREEGGHRPLRSAPRASTSPTSGAARPAARRQGAGPAAGAGRRMGDRHAPPAGLSADEPPGRTRVGLRVDRVPRQPPEHLARPHRRRQARAGLGQGEHRRLRR